MDRPRSSSDNLILFACPACLGNGGYGTRSEIKNPFTDCGSCQGSGWIAKRIDELTPIQAHTLREKLRAIPDDPEEAYEGAAVMRHLRKQLVKSWIEDIAFPDNEPRAIDLINKRGQVLRILPQFYGRKFHNINAIPQPPLPRQPHWPAKAP